MMMDEKESWEVGVGGEPESTLHLLPPQAPPLTFSAAAAAQGLSQPGTVIHTP